MRLKPEIFREYDIRGIVGKDLTPETVEILGRGIGTYVRRHGKNTVALGRDCRLSSPEFAAALTRGLLSTGCDILDLGTIPTPLLYFCVYTQDQEAGVMITGSHNPPEYNGFKLMLGHETLFGQDIQDIRRLIEDQDFISEAGGESRDYDIVPEYHRYVVENIHLDRPLKVVVDAGNGTGGEVAVPIFSDLGCDVVPLYCEMDGNFPHHHPDPTLPEALEDLIRTVK
jgi:phosphomannomutase/phosphoglucomutase